MTIEEAYNDFAKKLAGIYDKREAGNIADWVFEIVTQKKKLERINNKQQILPDKEFENLKIKLADLLNHKPVQYVLEEAWFYKMKFKINEHVLIPRPETEELVEWILNSVQNKKSELNITEIGAGSGCIAIALKKELQFSKIFSADISKKALEIAIENADTLNVKINFSHLNFLNEKCWNKFPKSDIIVSNPPYIPLKERSNLSKNVVDFEPSVALFVEDNDPFIFYKKILAFAKEYLYPEGKIFVEIHENYAEEILKIFKENNFKPVIKKDFFGKNRMICGNK